MFKIFLRNKEGNYYFPIYVDTLEEVYEIIFKYKFIVPSIQVTDNGDSLILETLNNDILYPEFLEDKLNILDNEYGNKDFTFNYLLKLYQEQRFNLHKLNKEKLKKSIRKTDIALQAIAVKDSIDLYKHGYKNVEEIITHLEMANESTDYKADYFDTFQKDIENGKTLIVMPLDRVYFENEFNLSNFKFFPIETLDLTDIYDIEYPFFDDGVRRVTSKATQFTSDTIYSSHCIAFTYDIDWNKFKNNNHSDDLTLLKILSMEASKIFDVIKLNYCNFTVPDLLPSEVGSWNDSSDYLGAFLYNTEDTNGYLIAGSAIESTKLVKGIGLDMNDISHHAIQVPLLTDGEVSKVVIYALALFSDIMQSSNQTIKFIRIMSLFEYLAYPKKYMKFQEVKKYIICHYAQDKTEYHILSDRFITLSKDYRTEIVHNAKSIETLIYKEAERKELFIELENYCRNVIDFMIK